jgi:DNA-binding NtrC family response regulator
VLIYGETGSGKELVAQAIHAVSRRDGEIVALNVCALADSMFEAALFGHVRGAFTGAVGDSLGFLAEANGGTLFLDEISGLPAVAQAKLLRAVETKQFRPIGARMDRRSDFRVIAASNENLQQLASAGRFRADLLQRLSGVCVRVPPLRARVEDLPALIAHFATACSKGTPASRFSAAAVERLQAHPWPGNVRELRHVVECALALSDTEVVSVREVECLLGGGDAAVASHREAYEDRALLLALEEANWDVGEAARRLGIHRATIYRRLKRMPPAVKAGPLPSSSSGGEAPRLALEA